MKSTFKHSDLVCVVEKLLQQHNDKSYYKLSNEIVKVLKDLNLIRVDLKCDFCDEKCLNSWCESSYEAKKTE